MALKAAGTLIKAVVRAHDWWGRLLTGKASSLNEIASTEGITGPYVRRMVELAFLAPDITMSILDGRQPVDLTTQRLINLRTLPVRWTKQRKVL